MSPDNLTPLVDSKIVVEPYKTIGIIFFNVSFYTSLGFLLSAIYWLHIPLLTKNRILPGPVVTLMTRLALWRRDMQIFTLGENFFLATSFLPYLLSVCLANKG